MSEVLIRSLKESDYKGWLQLYTLYADFYKTSLTEIGIETTWNWLMDSSHPCTGILAEQDNMIIAFAHFRGMPNPLRGENIGFLDDLYILPNYRGGKIVKLLFKTLKEYSRGNKWQIIRWITRDDNYRAKSVYDKIASKTNWNTYEMKM
jgi:ribosomal protein S18 acetylase RimI-like enzyme